MAFKTVGRYDEDENYTGILDFGVQMNKSLTEKFDERIKWVRDMDRAKRVETAQVCLAYIAQTVQEIITDGEQLSDWLFTFLACANELACAGLDPVQYVKKKELAEMLNLFGDEYEWLKKDMFFDWKQFRDKDHQMLVHSFLGICKDPGLHQYPDTVANYLLVACCADRPNENGIKAARYVWTEYLDYVRRVKRDPNYEYTGTYDRSHFRTSSEQGRVDAQQRQAEAQQKRAAEAAAKQAEEDRRNQPGKLKNLHKGDTFLFGSYPQSSRSASDRVEWIVLEQQASRILVISKKVLDDQAFHREKKTTPWCDSLIRTWLDTTFFQKAFNDDERKLILPTAIHEPDNTGTVHSTTDRVFLLSETELRKYMPKPEDRKAEGTNVSNNQYWGLRSYQQGADSFRYVTAKGLIQSNKFGTDGFTYTNYDCTIGVRPAMWLETRGESVDAYAQKEEEKAAEQMRLQEENEKAEAAKKLEEARKKEAAWRAECTKILEQRLQELDKQVEKERQRLLAEAKNHMEKEQSKLQRELDNHLAKKQQAEQELGGLKFYQFGRKKELREAIEYAERIIPKKEQEKASWEEWFQDEQKKIAEKLPAYREEKKKSVEANHPLPRKTAAAVQPKLFMGKISASELKSKIEKLGVVTKEELKKHIGRDISDDLETLKQRGLVDSLSVRGEIYYLAQSDNTLRVLGGEVWESPEEIEQRKTREENERLKMRILDCLCRSRTWMTCSDIVRAMLDEGVSIVRVSALVNQLVAQGLVDKKTERRVSYFRA